MNSEAVWYWVEDGERRGPETDAWLRARFEAGESPAETLVWQAGMESWVEAGVSVAFSDCWPAGPEEDLDEGEAGEAPAEAQAQTVGEDPAQPPEPPPRDREPDARPRRSPFPSREQKVQVVEVPAAQRRPFVRFFARLIDQLSWLLILSFVFAAFGSSPFEANLDPFVGFVVMMGFLLSEATCLTRWGMTPGKWLLRVRVIAADGRPPTFAIALRRGILVHVFGFALGIFFPLTLGAMVWHFLAVRERGMTIWDRFTGVFVIHDTVPATRGLVGALWISGVTLALNARHPEAVDQFMDATNSENGASGSMDAPLEEPALEDHPDDVLRGFPRSED